MTSNISGSDAILAAFNGESGGLDVANALEILGEELAGRQRPAAGDATAFWLEVEGTPRKPGPLHLDETRRIASEALRNAFHHSRARRIEVEIRYDARQLRVRVRDDGIGIDAGVLGPQGRAERWGLRGMRESAKRIGARLEVWSRHGAGTEVELTIPASVAYGNHASPPILTFRR